MDRASGEGPTLTPSKPGALEAHLASLKANRPQYTPMAERQAMVTARAMDERTAWKPGFLAGVFFHAA